MTSEVWGARLDGGYLGNDWVRELLADFRSEENRADMLEKELLNKKTSLEQLRGILCTVADRAERAEVREAALREALEVSCRLMGHADIDWPESIDAALAVKP